MPCRPLLAIALVAATAIPASAQEEHDHSGHAHGQARMTALMLGPAVTVRMKMTGGDLFGKLDFGDGPDAAAKKAEAKKERTQSAAKALVAQSDAFLRLPAAAECRLEAHDAVMMRIDHGAHKGHADIAATWNFACAAPQALTGLTLTAFTRGTGLRMVALTVIDGSQSYGFDVTPETASVRWGRGGS